MKILFLDDQEHRHRHFNRSYKKEDVYCAYTSEEALELLKKHSPFDEVFLDHDLGGFYLPSDDISGFGVAKFIARMDEGLRPGHVTVHSWNEEGACNMVRVLREAGIDVIYEPFRV